MTTAMVLRDCATHHEGFSAFRKMADDGVTVLEFGKCYDCGQYVAIEYDRSTATDTVRLLTETEIALIDPYATEQARPLWSAGAYLDIGSNGQPKRILTAESGGSDAALQSAKGRSYARLRRSQVSEVSNARSPEQ